MNLYLTADGRYVGTQAEAKRSGKGWTPEIVPTDKEGLIDYLNRDHGEMSLAQARTHMAVEEMFDEPAPPPAPKPTVDLEASYTTIEIEEFIINRAHDAQIEAIFAALGARYAAAVKRKEAN